MINRLVFGIVTLLVVSCHPRPRVDDFQSYHAPPPIETNEVKYHYRYGIDDPASGVITHKWEERLGAYVKGAYSLVEPDGRVRTVDYEVDGPKGFHAVIRTSLPGSSWLSYQQLSKSRQNHGNPPVNILTNNPVKTPIVDPKPQKKIIAKDLPPNFHSYKPDYFWGDLPHDHFDNHGKTHSEHGRHSPSDHSSHEHQHHHHQAHSNGGNLNEYRRNGEEQNNQNGFNPGGDSRKWGGGEGGQYEPRDYMTPPDRNAQIMNYDPLKPGMITDVIYKG